VGSVENKEKKISAFQKLIDPANAKSQLSETDLKAQGTLDHQDLFSWIQRF
jgi:hypothetical protein